VPLTRHEFWERRGSRGVRFATTPRLPSEAAPRQMAQTLLSVLCESSRGHGRNASDRGDGSCIAESISDSRRGQDRSAVDVQQRR